MESGRTISWASSVSQCIIMKSLRRSASQDDLVFRIDKMNLKGKTIILAITGGIAAYKTVQLVSDLKKLGAQLHIVMSKNAGKFVASLSLEVMSENKVYSSGLLRQDEPRNDDADIDHIKLADKADLVLIAPATANCMAKLATGISDEIIYDLVLATKAPILIAPAMNTNMWQHTVTQQNYRKLKSIGYHFIDPEHGELACKHVGHGRLAEFDSIIESVCNLIGVEQKLAGKKILISLGATREKIDPVRFLTNQSSGKMGFALIEAALAQGAQVTAVTTMDLPRRADKVVRVESHEQMQDALRQEFPDHDVLIMVAAVADYKPKAIAAQKIKTQQNLTVEFEQTTDIVAELAAGKKSNQVVVAFSVETENALEKAQDKIKRKNLDLIVVNSPAAFGADEAEVSIVDAEGELTKLTKSSKSLIAKKVLDCLNIPSKIVS